MYRYDIFLAYCEHGCQYQCNSFPGKTCLRNDPVTCRVGRYTLITHSLTHSFSIQWS